MYQSPKDELPHELILSIQRVLDLHSSAQSDSLDNLAEFNPVDILNQYFPDEESLGQLADVQGKLAQDEQSLRDEILALQEELRLHQDPGKMQLIQEMISDLLGQMSRIREKATESEAIVRDITKDIQVLDLAKANLILSMTTLKRLQMLVNAMSQLDDYVKDKKYPEITQSLAAVKEISASFKPYTSVPRIAQLCRRIQELQGEIRTILEADFDSFYLQTPTSPKPSTILAACATADVLGSDVRAALTARYTALLLAEYRRIFRIADEAGQLDNISRRFAWFRRVLSTHEGGLGRAFLEDWKVGWSLVGGFVEVTRDNMAALLSKAGKDLTVTVLLDALQQTKDFELSIARKFAVSFQDILKATSTAPGQTLQSISSAFEPHMGVYVRAQDKTISEMLASHRGVKSRTSLETSHSRTASEDGVTPPVVVLPSSTELFYFYGQTLEGCAMLSTGRPLYELFEVFKKWLHVYAEEILMTTLKRSQPQARRSMDTRYDVNEVKNASLVINTADYCYTTAQELEERLRQRIAEEFKAKVSLQNECDLFIRDLSAASTSIVVLIREVESACEPALNTLTRTSWINHEQVTGPSSFVNDLVHALEQVTDSVRPLVESKKYLRNFFDKTASTIMARFTNAIVRSRPLKENGAEQLLIDLSALKTCLLKLPGEALLTSGYTRSITKSTQRLEALLKVIVTPQDPAEGFILNYTLLIGDDSFSNFQKVPMSLCSAPHGGAPHGCPTALTRLQILDLKGTLRTEQNDLLDAFVASTSTKPDLEHTSFLSSLDMDPPTAASALTSPGGSRVALGEGLHLGLASPPPSRSEADTPPRDGKREVFSDIRRLMNFAVRRETGM
ncbi:Vps53-like protein [Amylostereum chailletii]|nr:Vps53-like protein [Amylostereum chailletii]